TVRPSASGRVKLGALRPSVIAATLRTRSDLLQHRIGVADLELAWPLDVDRLHDAVVDQHRIALRAHAHAAGAAVELEAERLGEGRAAVGHPAHLTLALLVLAPRAHHEGVVDGNAPDLVHALGPELVDVLRVARHVLGRAGGRERAGHAEDHDLLA